MHFVYLNHSALTYKGKFQYALQEALDLIVPEMQKLMQKVMLGAHLCNAHEENVHSTSLYRSQKLMTPLHRRT